MSWLCVLVRWKRIERIRSASPGARRTCACFTVACATSPPLRRAGASTGACDKPTQLWGRAVNNPSRAECVRAHCGRPRRRSSAGPSLASLLSRCSSELSLMHPRSFALPYQHGNRPLTDRAPIDRLAASRLSFRSAGAFL